MANSNLFSSQISGRGPKADTTNEAGGSAYKLSPEQALAQYVATGCFNDTYYAGAEDQLLKVADLASKVDTQFLAQCALYGREQGSMKDMPAYLCAVLAVRDVDTLEKVFDRVIDNGRMLRNFVQIVRSGATGRKSLGTAPKRLVRRWLARQSDESLFRASVGNSPSLADVVKMVHPKPQDDKRNSMYGYLLGKDYNLELLPQLVQHFEVYKGGFRDEVPKVPFQMLTSLDLGTKEWTEIAKNAPWQMTRMNLNTFLRHGVFEDRKMIELVAQRLANPELVRRARVFPYQLMAAYMTAHEKLPRSIRNALQDAMEVSINNVPRFSGKVYVCPDVSGSMGSPVTGYRKGATSKVRCVDVAALFAAAVLRKNSEAEVLPFDTSISKVNINSRDSVMTNAQRLTQAWGGGTDCSVPLKHLNHEKAMGDLVIYVSDNESWVDSSRYGATRTMQQWEVFKRRNPKAKLVCIDIQPYGTTQAKSTPDVLNIGGFSDAVFEVIAGFASAKSGADHWVEKIRTINL